MAVPFPPNIPAPSSRSYSPGEYPQREFQAQNGVKTVIRYGKHRYDSTLTDGYFYYTDSLRNKNGDFFYYSDSTTESTGGVEKFYRHSIRPKFKIKLFDESLVFDYRLFYKPRVDDWEDYLLEHSLQISIATFYDALTLNFNYSDKYNSRYDLKTNGGIRFINPETGVLFKERDSSINIGFSFMF